MMPRPARNIDRRPASGGRSSPEAPALAARRGDSTTSSSESGVDVSGTDRMNTPTKRHARRRRRRRDLELDRTGREPAAQFGAPPPVAARCGRAGATASRPARRARRPTRARRQAEHAQHHRQTQPRVTASLRPPSRQPSQPGDVRVAARRRRRPGRGASTIGQLSTGAIRSARARRRRRARIVPAHRPAAAPATGAGAHGACPGSDRTDPRTAPCRASAEHLRGKCPRVRCAAVSSLTTCRNSVWTATSAPPNGVLPRACRYMITPSA